MRLKPVPAAPADVDGLWAAREAVPLVPRPEDDCCARVMDRHGVASRDEARTWLTFLRALGLVAERDGSFYRTREEPGRAELAGRFREHVYAAREVLEALDGADEPRHAPAVFAAVEDVVPQWERHKDPAWERTWRRRVSRLLDWAVLFGLAERVDDGYRRVRQS
jgi:hypothetical protein